LFQRKICFRGLVVNTSGLQVDEEKIACIKTWEFPHEVTELRSFHGFCNYYHAFLPRLFVSCSAAAEMLQKGVQYFPLNPGLKYTVTSKSSLMLPSLGNVQG